MGPLLIQEYFKATLRILHSDKRPPGHILPGQLSNRASFTWTCVGAPLYNQTWNVSTECFLLSRASPGAYRSRKQEDKEM